MDNMVEVLKALSDETRFKIINILLNNDYCVGALACSIGVSKAAVSQHLQILRKAGLVKGEKRGYWTHYSVEKKAIERLSESLKKLASQYRLTNVCSHHNIREEVKNVCEECKCIFPEKLKNTKGKCSPEQIKECHGDVKEHVCEVEEKEE